MWCSHLIAKWSKYLKDSLTLPKISNLQEHKWMQNFVVLIGRVAIKGYWDCSQHLQDLYNYVIVDISWIYIYNGLQFSGSLCFIIQCWMAWTLLNLESKSKWNPMRLLCFAPPLLQMSSVFIICPYWRLSVMVSCEPDSVIKMCLGN